MTSEDKVRWECGSIGYYIGTGHAALTRAVKWGGSFIRRSFNNELHVYDASHLFSTNRPTRKQWDNLATKLLEEFIVKNCPRVLTYAEFQQKKKSLEQAGFKQTRNITILKKCLGATLHPIVHLSKQDILTRTYFARPAHVEAAKALAATRRGQ